MQEHPYWHQQTAKTPLYPDIEWSKPEQKSQAGKLGIIGGNKLSFIGVAESYSTALATGVGEVRVLLPDALKKSMPPVMTDVVYSHTNPSGGLGADALPDIITVAKWATGLLLIGDTGQNSETAILYERFIREYNGPLTITRDAVDLLKICSQMLVDRPNTLFVVSFSQLQKIFRAVYYPIVLTFSMQLVNLVEALHKFTITYPATIAVFHNETMIVACEGKVTTTPYAKPMDIWRGKTATIAACYLLWNSSRMLESVSASLIKN